MHSSGGLANNSVLHLMGFICAIPRSVSIFPWDGTSSIGFLCVETSNTHFQLIMCNCAAGCFASICSLSECKPLCSPTRQYAFPRLKPCRMEALTLLTLPTLCTELSEIFSTNSSLNSFCQRWNPYYFNVV